jgi:hypothetical protein
VAGVSSVFFLLFFLGFPAIWEAEAGGLPLEEEEEEEEEEVVVVEEEVELAGPGLLREDVVEDPEAREEDGVIEEVEEDGVIEEVEPVTRSSSSIFSSSSSSSASSFASRPISSAPAGRARPGACTHRPGLLYLLAHGNDLCVCHMRRKNTCRRRIHVGGGYM